MLNRSAGAEIARAHVARNWEPLPAPDAWTLVDESTIERPWGWVFVFTSKSWLDTRDVQYAVGGNTPLLVERATGSVVPLGTAHPVSYYVEAYERLTVMVTAGRHDG